DIIFVILRKLAGLACLAARAAGAQASAARSLMASALPAPRVAGDPTPNAPRIADIATGGRS
ncbi:MAG TPA: hypothetical protein VG818_00495, partial [Gemmatimonadaceae bacterium]|nr:hypothetical protein [Gemmatimonadaceae bacterium]